MLVDAADAGIRLNGRRLGERRPIKVTKFSTSVKVSFGDETVVLGSLNASKVMPYPEKPNEGALTISCNYGRCSAPKVGIRVPRGDYIAQAIDSLLKGSNAIDMHSLCLLSGKLVWNLRIHLQIVVDQGNVIDAACICALAVLSAFRKQGQAEDTIAPPLLHQPLLVSHCLIQTPSKRLVLMTDPTKEEETEAAAVVTVGSNAAGDVCLVNKFGGVAIPASVISDCIAAAQKQVIEIYQSLEL